MRKIMSVMLALVMLVTVLIPTGCALTQPGGKDPGGSTDPADPGQDPDNPGSGDTDPVVEVIDLSVSEKEFLVSNEKKTLVFYAKVKEGEESLDLTGLTLFDAGNASLAEMKDDGLTDISGDEIPGDGIFACKTERDLSAEGDYGYMAKVNTGQSNRVSLSIINGPTDVEFETMDRVDRTLHDAMTADELEEERKVKVGAALESLVAQGDIMAGSIHYDEESLMYTFTYACDVWGGVQIRRPDYGLLLSDDDQGSAEESAAVPSDEGSDSAEGTETAAVELKSSALPSSSLFTHMPFVHKSMASSTASDSSYAPLGASLQDPDKLFGTNVLADAVLMDAYDPWAILAYLNYRGINLGKAANMLADVSTYAMWDSAGVITKSLKDQDVTVEFIKTKLKNYEIIKYRGQGGNYLAGPGYDYQQKLTPVWILSERPSREKERLYWHDLTKKRVAKIVNNSYSGDGFPDNIAPDVLRGMKDMFGQPPSIDEHSTYAVFPSLIEASYSEGDLRNSFIISGSDSFFAGDSVYGDKFAFADAFKKKGAKAVVGFQDAVNSNYSDAFTDRVCVRLIEGDTIKQSFEKATSDPFISQKSHDENHPILSARDEDAAIIFQRIENGSFEKVEKAKDIEGAAIDLPVDWITRGNVKAIQAETFYDYRGAPTERTPSNGNYMLCIEGSYSAIRQAFKVIGYSDNAAIVVDYIRSAGESYYKWEKMSIKIKGSIMFDEKHRKCILELYGGGSFTALLDNVRIQEG